jgi:hypothetical protein
MVGQRAARRRLGPFAAADRQRDAPEPSMALGRQGARRDQLIDVPRVAADDVSRLAVRYPPQDVGVEGDAQVRRNPFRRGERSDRPGKLGLDRDRS